MALLYCTRNWAQRVVPPVPNIQYRIHCKKVFQHGDTEDTEKRLEVAGSRWQVNYLQTCHLHTCHFSFSVPSPSEHRGEPEGGLRAFVAKRCVGYLYGYVPCSQK